jgi:RNA polymerase sigma-70 factor (ECF subfamily)
MGDMTDLEAQKVSPSSDLEEFYRRSGSDLVRFASVLVGRDDANDVVSATVLRLLDAGHDSVRDHRAYLFQAVANEARNWKRGSARRRAREERSSGRDVSYPSESYPEVRRAVEQLSVRQRAVTYLTYREDLNEQAVADHLAISAGSVRRHLARARNKLRGVLDENG